MHQIENCCRLSTAATTTAWRTQEAVAEEGCTKHEKNENNETTKRHKNNNEYNDNNTSECDWVLGLELRIGDWVSKWRVRVRGIRKGRKGGKWFLFVANGIFLLSLARRIVFSVPFFKLGYLGQRKTKPGEE